MADSSENKMFNYCVVRTLLLTPYITYRILHMM
jgi:hypothetical protein